MRKIIYFLILIIFITGCAKRDEKVISGCPSYLVLKSDFDNSIRTQAAIKYMKELIEKQEEWTDHFTEVVLKLKELEEKINMLENKDK